MARISGLCTLSVRRELRLAPILAFYATSAHRQKRPFFPVVSAYALTPRNGRFVLCPGRVCRYLLDLLGGVKRHVPCKGLTLLREVWSAKPSTNKLFTLLSERGRLALVVPSVWATPRGCPTVGLPRPVNRYHKQSNWLRRYGQHVAGTTDTHNQRWCFRIGFDLAPQAVDPRLHQITGLLC